MAPVLRRQRIDDPAVCYRALAALIKQTGEFALERLQIRDLLFDRVELIACNLVDSTAGTRTIVGKVEQRAHLVECEPKIARAADERQPVEMGLFVGAVVAAGARGRGNEPFLLVETDGFDARVGQAGQIADLHA